MADVQLRELYRRGEYTRLTRAAQRIGALILWCYEYGGELITPSFLETECATKDCKNSLMWSNCCYCKECYGHDSDDRVDNNKSRCMVDNAPNSPFIVARGNYTHEPIGIVADKSIYDCACSLAGIEHRQIPKEQDVINT